TWGDSRPMPGGTVMSVSTYNYTQPRRKSSAGATVIQFMNTVGVSIFATVGGLVFAFATHLMM
ncbi:MAG: hypothetical protein ACKVH7_12225, partial [Alphaproteobacteria bacterium]